MPRLCSGPQVNDTKQDDLLKAYFRLCGDERGTHCRAASKVFNFVASNVQIHSLLDTSLDRFINTFRCLGL